MKVSRGVKGSVSILTAVALVVLSACGSEKGGSSGAETTAPAGGSSEMPSSSAGGGDESEQSAPGSDSELTPITIGVLAPISGPLPNIGEAMSNGYTIGAKLLSGPETGFDIELKIADTQYDPTVAVQQFRQLASDGTVSIIQGLPSSSSCKAVSEVATALEQVYIGDCIDASLLENPSPYFVMGAAGAVDLAHGAAARAHDRFPDVVEWDTYALDYVTGRGVVSNFEAGIKENGGALGKSVWAPLDATDVRPFLTSLQQATPLGSNKGLMVYAFGDLGSSFLKQASTVELPDRYKVIVWVNADDLALKGVGAALPEIEAVTDVMTEAYLPMDDGLLAKFIEEYESEFGTYPPDQATKSLKELQVGISAAKKANSTKSSDIQKVLVGLQPDTLKGDTVVNEQHYLEQSVVGGTCKGDASDPKGRNFSCENVSVISF